MGVLGMDIRKTDASSRYEDRRVAATEQSPVAYAEGAMAAGGALYQTNPYSTLSVNEVFNDPALATVAIKQQKKLADSFLSAFKAKDETLADMLARQATLSELVATGGESGRNKTMLYVTLAVLALVGWIFWKR